MGRVSGRSCIVTGAARGIGRAIGEALVGEGADVCFADLDVARVEAVAAACRDTAERTGAKVTACAVDVTRRDTVRAMIGHAVDVFGKIDVVFNNAGVNKPMNFLDVTEENWHFIMDVNGLGCLIGMQEAARQMIAQGSGGKIVNTASIASRQGFDNVAPYCASKAGLDGLTKAAAIELAAHNIRVNGVAPGDIYTEASADVVEQAVDRGATGKFFRFTPLNRRGSPEEIGNVVAFLASDESSFVTGATWLVDGGFLSY